MHLKVLLPFLIPLAATTALPYADAETTTLQGITKRDQACLGNLAKDQDAVSAYQELAEICGTGLRFKHMITVYRGSSFAYLNAWGEPQTCTKEKVLAGMEQVIALCGEGRKGFVEYGDRVDYGLADRGDLVG